MPPTFLLISNFSLKMRPQEEQPSTPCNDLNVLRRHAEDTLGASALPLAANVARDSGIPEIGGSSAGFIVLIVALAVIFLICSISVFFLLRSSRPDAFERQARRALAGPREESLYEMPLGPAGVRVKFKNFFRFGKRKHNFSKIDSIDVDDWDASEETRPGHGQARELTDHDVRMVSHTLELPQGVRPPVQRNSTSDSIELSVPNMGIDTAFPHPPYSDPFSTSPIAMVSSEEIPGTLPPQSAYSPCGNSKEGPSSKK